MEMCVEVMGVLTIVVEGIDFYERMVDPRWA